MIRLFGQFVGRRLLGERTRTLTTMAGIALGIAMVIAIQLTNASSVRGFETALDTVSGRAAIDITAPGGIDETLLPGLGWLREFGPVSPVIEGEMALVTGDAPTAYRPRRTEAVKVLGVDILRDRAIRDYAVSALAPSSAARDGAAATAQASGAPLTSQQFLAILTSPQSVVITEKLARRRGYAVGDEIRLMTGDRVGRYVVRALLQDTGPARVMDGSFVLMDIAAAQLAFARLGRVDRLDVPLTRSATALDPSQAPTSADIDAAVAAIAARLPAGLTAGRPSRRGQQVEKMLAAFHLNLAALSWVALVVGLFLVYNTATTNVLARREEIGMLRALGVTRRQVVALFLGEAVLLGVAGTVAGIGLGRLLADWAVGLTGATVSTLYIATAAAPPALTLAHVGIALAIGVPLSLLAAALPALEASRVPPTAAIRGSDRLESRVRMSPRAFVVPAVVLGAAAGLTRLGPVDGRPLGGYAAALAIIVGAALLVPVVLFLLARAVRQPLRRLLGAEGLLAHAHLASAIPRLAISVAALAVSLAMMVAVAVMIGSFRDTVVYWVGQTLQADLFVGPGVQPTVGSSQTLSADVIEAVRRHPQVEAVDTFRNADLVYRGNLVVLGAGQFEVVRSHGALLFKIPADGRAALARAIGRDAVVVSEPFANRYGVAPGDTVSLPTPAGDRPFTVEGVYYDYAVDRGVVAMDRATFVRHFGDLPPTSLAVYLRDGASADDVRQQILDGLDDGRRAFVYTNRALRAEVLRIFDSTFAITYALELIAIVVAMLGVAATLLTLVLERRRELGMLRLIGAARRQVQRLVVVEATLIGAASMAIGLVVGLALSLVLVFVINVQSFGWTIQFRVPWLFLGQVSLAVVAATALAGLLPARRAARLVVEHEE
ncbi:MAG: FtsX-like permease family protein [Vicinamibacterales bacterium]